MELQVRTVMYKKMCVVWNIALFKFSGMQHMPRKARASSETKDALRNMRPFGGRTKKGEIISVKIYVNVEAEAVCLVS
jgi:hypothetical protein